MEQSLLNIGFGCNIVAEHVIGIMSPNSQPMKRVKDEAKESRHLIDATFGRKTRAIIITDSNHVFLSAILAETISQRFAALTDKTE
jgi:extracellular matrix regulatory protein A